MRITSVFSIFIHCVTTVFLVTLLSFLLFRYVGDPITNMVGQDASSAARDLARAQLGLDDPPVMQFARFLWNCANGRFGVSYRYSTDVASLISVRLPASAELALASGIVSIVIGGSIAVSTNVMRPMTGSGLKLPLGRPLAVILMSTPSFVVAIALSASMSAWLQWFPTMGRGDTVTIGWWATGLLTWSGLRALILPSLAIAASNAAVLALIIGTELRQALTAGYAITALAKGALRTRVVLSHVMPNIAGPVMTVSGMQIGSTMAFGVAVESVFSWPGLGLLFVEAARVADIPVLASLMLVNSCAFVAINGIFRVWHAVIDPVSGDRDGQANEI